MILEVQENLPLPKKVEVMHLRGYKKSLSFEAKGNKRADQAAKEGWINITNGCFLNLDTPIKRQVTVGYYVKGG